MRIAFDGSCLGGARPTGVERAFLRSIRAMARLGAHELTLFVPHDLHATIRDRADDDLHIPESIGLREIPRVPLSLWRSRLLPGALGRLDIEALWSPTTALPPRAPCARIATVHEIASVQRDAEDSVLRGIRQRRARIALRQRATVVVVPSERTAHDLLRESPGLSSEIRVVPQPLNETLLAATRSRSSANDRGDTAEERRGFVFVGRAMRRKNLDAITAAWRRLPDSARRRHPLTWIGASDSDRQHVDATAWRHTSATTTDDLVRELTRARGLVLASKSEGFGLPALEALACGTPPIVARGTTPADLCGDLAAPCDPYDVASVTASFERCLADDALLSRVAREGPALASSFSPERTVDHWIDILAEASPVRREVAP